MTTTAKSLSPSSLKLALHTSINTRSNKTEKKIDQQTSNPSISFVIPVRNNEATIGELVNSIRANTRSYDVEIILIDDASTDDTWSVIKILAELHPETVRGLQFRSRSGRSASLQAGFDAVQGDVVFTIDATLQDSPREIPRFIQRINDGYDVVSAWKVANAEPHLNNLPSRMLDAISKRLAKSNDSECMFKCYRRKVVKTILALDDHHSKLPMLAKMQGFKATEIIIEQNPSIRIAAKKRSSESLASQFLTVVGLVKIPSSRKRRFRSSGEVVADTNVLTPKQCTCPFDQYERRYVVEESHELLSASA